ncbi:MAG: carotenoid 1,2-hydratase [Kordiimonadaceae bacterium]|nr:carotenoid 1,2-hydratase [Kordiimonadaceae bacterium]MBT6036563.1 carotenoid 1,2-hydratase [Kordiimonadaceae bacterium]MBT6329938.1 carotenoid 1,2-hydratase [Kordiimonadaceae bacterium]MBT7581860.1 carotenoid 1,2-hydratase [Kordiimonadaceae bacterium]
MLKYIIVFLTLISSVNAQQTTSSGRLDILRDVEEQGFLRAKTLKEFNFPADHGPHPGYRHEWWYATGNLDAQDGKHFGYELTFFRLAMAPETEKEKSGSEWKTPLAFAAHFAVTDVDGEDFDFFQRYSRGDGRLAGATGSRVWLEDWTLNMSVDNWSIKAADGDIKLDLKLEAIKPVIFNGDQGLSQKSAAPGNATYYYSLPRLKSNGTLEIDGQMHSVEGLTWLDREWGTSALAPEQQGWDWYALHLSDGSDLMFYNLRNQDGSRHPFSAGSFVSAHGEKTSLTADDLNIEVTDYWDSPLGGRYPSGWKLTLEDQNLELMIEPMIKNQELNTIPRYWEGAVDIEGTKRGQVISGNGYVELTGYSP